MASYSTSTLATQAPQPSILAEITGGYASHLSELHDVAGRLHRLADRVIGSRPESVGKAGAPTPDGSLVQTFKRNQSDLQDVLSQLRDATERLEAL